MKSHERHLAERMHKNSHIPYVVCADIVSALHRKDFVTLSRNLEKYLLTSDQNELLKEAGLTLNDIIIGSYDEVFSGTVDSIIDEWNERFGTKIFSGVVEQ